VDREHGTNNIVVTGSMAADAGPDQEFMAVWDVTGYAASLFRAALEAHGVRVLGPTTRGATPTGARTVADRRSMPLRELLTPFLKLSNNMHAEILVKAMGRAKSNQGSWDAGIAAINTVLPGLGIDPARMFLVDGSGLSRMDHVAPDQLSALLAAARSKPWFPTWFAALPVAGVADRLVGGTLRNRMRNTAAAGNVHAKTGSFTGASGLSGYVTAADGRALVFSMITNNAVGVSVRPIEDAVAIRLAGDTGARVADVQPAGGRSELEWCEVKDCH
jgi:D-alanyl-D-alanine carboxypeptidase/D-alanyl-D-alanine-endopeptidase (penicillin-binding protein 4)